VSHGRYFAEHIANARYVELDTDAHVPMFVDASLGETLTAIEEFVTGTVRHTADRRFAAILFVDIVDSTAEQRTRGDRAWRDVIASFETSARRTVAHHPRRHQRPLRALVGRVQQRREQDSDLAPSP